MDDSFTYDDWNTVVITEEYDDKAQENRLLEMRDCLADGGYQGVGPEGDNLLEGA